MHRRLTLLFRLVSWGSLAIAFLGFTLTLIVYSTTAFRQELVTVSKIIGATSRAALVFNDKEAGERVLAGLAEKPNITAAALVRTDAQILAQTGTGWAAEASIPLSEEHVHWTFTEVSIRAPVMLDSELVGSVFITASLSSLYQQVGVLLLIVAAVMGLAGVTAAYFSNGLKAWVSDPIESLHELTKKVTHTRDLSSRLQSAGGDEIQQLIQSVNTMLEELERRDAEIQSAKARAEEALRVKSLFLATVSHELRTPIHAVLGMTDEVLETDVTNEQREMLEVVKSAGSSLLYVINDILDFSAIEAGKIRLTPAPFEFQGFVERVVKIFELAARRKELELKVNIDARIPEFVVGDSGRLSQLLVNLIGNAIKFTPAGEVVLTVEMRARNERAQTVRLHFSVKDTGIGIEKSDLSSIFESFTKIRRVGENIEGTGLGLAIAARLVALMGGQIWAESEVGKGSTFHFTVDCGISEASAQNIRARPRSDRALRKKDTLSPFRVLVAEDNAVNRQLAVRILQKAGYEAVSALNGEQCLEILSTEPIDLVLMDLDMPVIDGFQATRVIREREQGAQNHLPIVAFTASVGPDGLQKCIDCGMDAFLNKPIDKDTLLSTIESFLIKDAEPGSTTNAH